MTAFETVVIHCDYDEFHSETYRGMVFWDEITGACVRFQTKDPLKDLCNCHLAAMSLGAKTILFSSSIDGYLVDKWGNT